MLRKLAIVSIIVLVLSLAFASVSFAQSGTTSSQSQNSSGQSNGNQGNNGQGLSYNNAFMSSSMGGQVAQNQQQWYRFEYAGDGSPIEIRLNGAGLQFSVWTQGDITNSGGDFSGTSKPTGRSNSNSNVNADQFWTGSFNTAGPIYVMVERMNGGMGDNGNAMGQYQLQVTGTGVSWKGQGASNNQSGNNSNNQSGSTSGATPRTLPKTGGEMASVLPILMGGLGALSVAAGAFLRRKK